MSSQKPVVAILLGAPFTAQNYERTGIPYLIENFDVVVLDCNPWIRSGYSSLTFEKHEYPRIESISSADEFRDAARRLRAAYAIDFIGFDPSIPLIRKILDSTGTRFVIQKTGTVPRPSIGGRRKELLRMALRNPFQLLLTAMRMLYRRSNVTSDADPDVALLAGRRSLDAFTRTAGSIVWIASNDYYDYKKVQEKLSRQEQVLPFSGEYSLFIDDCLALATDYALLGVSPPMDPEDYFKLLRESLDRLEQVTGLPVVVAAHPNGKEHENYTSLFGERQVYFDLTAELCSQSDLVFAHDSTALSYVALWSKPLVVLTSRALDRSPRAAELRERSIQFRCPLLFMDSNDDEYLSACRGGKEIDGAAYKTYADNFIITDEVTEDAPWQAFTRFAQQEANHRTP